MGWPAHGAVIVVISILETTTLDARLKWPYTFFNWAVLLKPTGLTMADDNLQTDALTTGENCFRNIILYGKNTASYKFALGLSLLELAKAGKPVVTLEELAPIFAQYICQHIKKAPRQITGSTGTFLTACMQFNTGQISYARLLDITQRHAFRHVLDRFHTVNREPSPLRFYDYDRKSQKLVLTDTLLGMAGDTYFDSLSLETEARWRLVETAWQQDSARELPRVVTDTTGENLVLDLAPEKQTPITRVRDALNGYQKGYCFFCFDHIAISPYASIPCNINHFLPGELPSSCPTVNLNGVWNLILSCPDCNDGESGRYLRLPAPKYLQRLYTRNEYLIGSDHPLRETLISQTGPTSQRRASFLREMYHFAEEKLPGGWTAPEKHQRPF